MEGPHLKCWRDPHRNEGNEVLEAMKTLTVREENIMVARVTLHRIKQDRGEPIYKYGARLRGQAGVCIFTHRYNNCDVDKDYTEGIL